MKRFNELLEKNMTPPCNCTRIEALKHYGFTEVGRKSIRGNSYSKCWYHEKLNIFAVQFMCRISFHKFMSRDENIQNEINNHTSHMWNRADVIQYFEKLSQLLSRPNAKPIFKPYK